MFPLPSCVPLFSVAVGTHSAHVPENDLHTACHEADGRTRSRVDWCLRFDDEKTSGTAAKGSLHTFSLNHYELPNKTSC